MGFVRHHAIIVTGFRAKEAEKAYEFAKGLEMSLSEIKTSPVNGYISFCVFTDGSKEGWPDSDKGDEQRKAFIEYLRSEFIEDNSSYLEWVEVWYGGDDSDAGVSANPWEGEEVE